MQIKFSKLYTLALIMLATIFGCDDMDSIHEQYLNGEQVYAGKLDSLNVFSGFERVKIVGNTQYLGNSKEATVSWDDQTQTFTIGQIVDNEFEIIIEGLVERNYEFDLVTSDENNNQSVKQTIRGRAFGDVFIAGQTARRIVKFDFSQSEDYIVWADKAESEYVVYTTIRYENNSDTMTEVKVNPDDETTLLEDWKHGGQLEIVSTVISGDNGFDTADLDVVQQTMPVPPSGLNKDWTLAATIKVSKEFFGGVNGAEGSPKVIDGDIFTKYLILDYNQEPEFWMQQDLQSPGIINFYTMTSGNDFPGRDPRDWELVGSNDETNWVTLDTRSGESFSGRNETNEYSFVSNTPYRYYRMNITSISGDPHFQLSEWRLYESDVPEIDFTGYILSAITVSKENPGGAGADEGSLKLVDGDTNSKFLIFDYPTTFWMQQKFYSKAIANKYTLTSGNDASSRDPKNWTLAGSNDEANWVALDTRTDESFAGRNETREFTFNSPTAYKYYRFYITANNGDVLFQLSEWRLLGN
jgi:hypothetical protein